MYISLRDLGLAVLVIAAICACIYSVVVLKNINDVVKQFKKLFKNNAENMNKIFAVLPDTVKNANELTVSAKDQIESIGPVVYSVGSSISETAAALSDKTTSGVSVVKSVIEFATVIKELLMKKE